jgi:DNA gyrase subunit B
MEKILALFERKNMDSVVLKSFIMEGLNEKDLSDYEKCKLLIEKIKKRVTTFDPNLSINEIKIDKDEEESKYFIEIKSQRNGLQRKTLIDFELTESPSFIEMSTIASKVNNIGDPPFILESEQNEIEIPNLEILVETAVEQGRKKLTIQRYKGLGEMNADQLWDTTMNPDNRKILQVAVDDAVKANEIFSTLMGDQVEPRREFIERNALNVMNLDY